MPRLMRTVIPKIRKSLKHRGLMRTLGRCLVGPFYLAREYRTSRSLLRMAIDTKFDRTFGVDTAGTVHLSDLRIDSPNWIYGISYWPTPSRTFQEAIAHLKINYEDFTFIDFGSGKGRVLLLACELPFKKIIGLEFSPELDAIAKKNIRNYRSGTRRCKDVTSACMDFTRFPLPKDPLVCFFYQSERGAHHGQSLRQHSEVLAGSSEEDLHHLSYTDV
jgi:SAM-dependent methyltransferase